MMSLRLKALDMPTSQTTVSRTRPHHGMKIRWSITPALSRTKTATAWPIALGLGVSAPKSSMRPTMVTMVEAKSRASSSSSKEKVMPMDNRKATKTARPPR